MWKSVEWSVAVVAVVAVVALAVGRWLLGALASWWWADDDAPPGDQ